MTDHNELRALALAATPGPWQAQQRNKQEAIYIVGPAGVPPACHAFYANSAAYIAAANPATVLALLDEVEAAHAARREAQARVAELTEQVQALGRELHQHKLDAARYRLLRSAEGRVFSTSLQNKEQNMTDTTNSVTGALQPVAWIRKNGIRFNAEAEPQDDSETALYSQTAIDTLRDQLAEAQTRVAELTEKMQALGRELHQHKLDAARYRRVNNG